MAGCQKSNKLIKLATYCNEINKLHTKKNTQNIGIQSWIRKKVVQTAECIRNSHEKKKQPYYWTIKGFIN